jgi:hypothetical protein
MNERIDKTFDDAGVYFGVLTGGHQVDFFARGSRHLPCRPTESRKGRPDRHHTSTGYFVTHA